VVDGPGLLDATLVRAALLAAARVAVESGRLSDESRRRQRWAEATSDIITQLLAGRRR
jgi:hypothetical protein